MFLFYFLLFVVADTFCIISITDATKTKFETYPIIRYLSDDGEFGSTGKRWGNSGILYSVLTREDLNEVLNNHIDSIAYGRNFVLYLNGSFFNKENINKLVKLKHISAIVVADDPNYFNTNYYPPPYSPDSKTSSKGDFHYLTNKTYEWNKYGDDFLTTSYSIPIIYVRNDTQEYLTRSAKYNKDNEYEFTRKLISFSAKMYLYGKKTSDYCLKKGRCKPIVGQTLFGFINYTEMTV
jgi:hypothetical protein